MKINCHGYYFRRYFILFIVDTATDTGTTLILTEENDNLKAECITNCITTESTVITWYVDGSLVPTDTEEILPGGGCACNSSQIRSTMVPQPITSDDIYVECHIDNGIHPPLVKQGRFTRVPF